MRKILSRREPVHIRKRRLVIVVLPAYNAEKTLERTYSDIPKDIVDEVVLVDDGSRDKTIQIAKRLGMKVYTHPQNRGYGGNQKTCYTLALTYGASIVVMIHPDYQYDPKRIPELVAAIMKGWYHIMLGSRIRTRTEALSGGMPLYKYVGNRFLTLVENLVTGQALSEYHTGMRAFDREVLQKLPFHRFSDDFVFDQQILISAIQQKYKIGEIQVPTLYFSEASSINFRRSVRYGLSTLWVLFMYVLDWLGIYTDKIFVSRRK